MNRAFRAYVRRVVIAALAGNLGVITIDHLG